MNLDDLLCVGATGPIMLSSTIGRNKNLIPGEVISEIINGTEEILSELRSYGLEIHSTGGETADVGDLVRTIIVDSTVVCRMRRDEVISNHNIQAGDVIVGLASDDCFLALEVALKSFFINCSIRATLGKSLFNFSCSSLAVFIPV